MNALLSIVIVSHKTPDLLRACIMSLQKTVRKTPYEIIAVDSESDGTTPRMLARDFPAVRCLAFGENTGYGRGVNSGLAAASGEYFLVLNPDVQATEGAVDDLVSFLRNESGKRNIGLVGPKLLNSDGTFQPSTFRFYTPWTILARRTPLCKLPFFKRDLARFFMEDKRLERAKKEEAVEWLRGSTLLTSREAVRKVGPMDERFFMYFEDVDWARRFWENGYKVVYYPKSVMYHQYLRKSHRFGIFDALFNKMTRWHIASALKYFLKYRFRTPHYA